MKPHGQRICDIVREVLSTSKAYLLYYEQQPVSYNPEPEPVALMMMDADVGEHDEKEESLMMCTTSHHHSHPASEKM